jgi:hypothetical protein
MTRQEPARDEGLDLLTYFSISNKTMDYGFGSEIWGKSDYVVKDNQKLSQYYDNIAEYEKSMINFCKTRSHEATFAADVYNLTIQALDLNIISYICLSNIFRSIICKKKRQELATNIFLNLKVQRGFTANQKHMLDICLINGANFDEVGSRLDFSGTKILIILNYCNSNQNITEHVKFIDRICSIIISSLSHKRDSAVLNCYLEVAFAIKKLKTCIGADLISLSNQRIIFSPMAKESYAEFLVYIISLCVDLINK